MYNGLRAFSSPAGPPRILEQPEGQDLADLPEMLVQREDGAAVLVGHKGNATDQPIDAPAG